MKFTCDKETLHDACSTAARAAEAGGSVRQALTGLRLEVANNILTATGTNLDVTLQTQISVNATEDGKVLPPARLFCDVIKVLPDGDVQLEADDKSLAVTGAAGEFTINLLDVADFPSAAEPEDYSSASDMDSKEFYEALSQVIIATSRDDSRPILTGVYFDASQGDDELVLVATDSYRLAERIFPAGDLLQGADSLLVPSKAVTEIMKLSDPKKNEPMTIRMSESQVEFSVQNQTLTTRLIPGDFPNYKGLIPTDTPTKLTINRNLLNDAVSRVKILAQDTTPIKLTLAEDEDLKLEAQTQDVGQAREMIPIDSLVGEGLTLAFNPDYFKAGLEAIDSDFITIGITDNVKPVTITNPDDDTYLYLLMPVRVA